VPDSTQTAPPHVQAGIEPVADLLGQSANREGVAVKEAHHLETSPARSITKLHHLPRVRVLCGSPRKSAACPMQRIWETTKRIRPDQDRQPPQGPGPARQGSRSDRNPEPHDDAKTEDQEPLRRGLLPGLEAR